MKTGQIRVLEGPNVWSRRRVLDVEIESTDTLSEDFSVAIRRLGHMLAEAEEQLESSEHAPLPSSAESAYDDAAVLLSLSLNFQRRVGLPVCEGFFVPNEKSNNSSRIIVEIVEENVGRLAFELACRIWTAALLNEPFNFSVSFKKFSELAFESCLGQTTGAIVNAALGMAIPVIRLDDVSLVQLGHGARQRRIQTAVSDRSGYIAEAVSRDKALTKTLLRRVGLPVPNGRVVCDADDAWAAATEFQSPVVVKPRDADYGQGVSLRLTTRAEVATAYAEARAYSEQVIVEQYLEGDHHRLLVIGGKVVAAVRFGRASVVGDGQRTVSELIEEMNRDPRRGARTDSTRPWFLMEVDVETRRVLTSQGSSLDHVPRIGERIVLRFEPRIGWGGGVFDITDEIHPDVTATVIDAVSMVGLDIAGVDLITGDISRPLEEQNGGILEVNAGPAILMHLRPFSDPPRPVPEAIVSLLFPHPEESRIPIVAVCGDDDCNPVTTRIAEILRTIHSNVGCAGRTGVFVNQRAISRNPGNDVQGARMLLLHPRVEAAAVDVSLDRIRHQGLAFDQCRVAVVMGLDSNTCAMESCLEDQSAALQVLLAGVQPAGSVVVNLDDPHVAEIAFQSNLDVIAISLDASHSLLDRGRRLGLRRVFLREGVVMLGQDSKEFRLFSLGVGILEVKNPHVSPKNLLATIATAWALGVSPELLRQQFGDTMNASNSRGQNGSIESPGFHLSDFLQR